jgi:uncharacterized repeat protein (TIGR01451 family)
MYQFSIKKRDALADGSKSGQAKSATLGKLASHTVALLGACVLGLFTLPAHAADADGSKANAPIGIVLKQFKVIKDEKGDTKLMDAPLVVPGDVIEYHATYSNHGKTALPVVATLPIPEALEYIKDSASATPRVAYTVALKDSQFAKEPLMQTTVAASGATLSQPVPYASYRYVRWDLGRLPAGSSVEVTVRAKVSQGADTDANATDKASAVLASTNPQKQSAKN